MVRSTSATKHAIWKPPNECTSDLSVNHRECLMVALDYRECCIKEASELHTQTGSLTVTFG